MKIVRKFNEYIRENIEDSISDEKPVENVENNDAEDHTEEDEYIGTKMLKDLASALKVSVTGNHIEYKGKTINFYSETEKFHVDKKKFATVEEVVKYLNDTPVENETDTFNREETIETLSNTSNFEDSDLEEMTDEELKNLYDSLETDEWTKEVSESSYITKRFNKFK